MTLEKKEGRCGQIIQFGSVCRAKSTDGKSQGVVVVTNPGTTDDFEAGSIFEHDGRLVIWRPGSISPEQLIEVIRVMDAEIALNAIRREWESEGLKDHKKLEEVMAGFKQYLDYPARTLL